MKSGNSREWKCRAGCSDCCGIVPLPSQTMIDHIELSQVLPRETIDLPNGDKVPLCEDGKCMFLIRDAKLCAIYEYRPQVCRDYGVIPELPCPYIASNGRLRSPAKARRMLRKINKDIDAKMKIIEKQTR